MIGKERWDVVVVGSGPAGSVCAEELAQRGVKTLLLEQERLPRYKACGGGVTAKTLPYLKCDISAIVQSRIDAATLSYRLGGEVTRNSPKPLAFTVNREDLDTLLARQAESAGAVLHEGEKAVRVEPCRDGLRIGTDIAEYGCSLVIAADGANSIVARASGIKSNIRNGISIESEIHADAASLAAWQGRVLLDLGSVPSGYAWIFPKADHLSVGVGGLGIDGRTLNAYHTAFQAYVAQRVGGYRLLQKKAHKLPTRTRRSPLVGERCILVGDAAGLVEPLSGEGIYFAVRSGRMAAEAATAWLAGGQNSALEAYRAKVESELMPEIQRAKAYLRIFNRAPGFFFRKLSTSRRLWRATCDLLNGDETYDAIGTTLGRLSFLLDLLAW